MHMTPPHVLSGPLPCSCRLHRLPESGPSPGHAHHVAAVAGQRGLPHRHQRRRHPMLVHRMRRAMHRREGQRKSNEGSGWGRGWRIGGLRDLHGVPALRSKEWKGGRE